MQYLNSIGCITVARDSRKDWQWHSHRHLQLPNATLSKSLIVDESGPGANQMIYTIMTFTITSTKAIHDIRYPCVPTWRNDKVGKVLKVCSLIAWLKAVKTPTKTIDTPLKAFGSSHVLIHLAIVGYRDLYQPKESNLSKYMFRPVSITRWNSLTSREMHLKPH